MTDILGNKNVAADDNPQWDQSIFHQGNLPPGVIAIDDMDLGADPWRPGEDPTPSLEGYWDRDDVNGYLYPKIGSDIVLIGSTAPYFDEKFAVTGKIYTTGGLMLGSGDTLIHEPISNVVQVVTGGSLVLTVQATHLSGANTGFPWRINNTNTPAAGYPTYTWLGDEDTGMFRLSANALGFSGGGTSLLELNANGSVRIVALPADDTGETFDAIVIDPATGFLYKRDIGELHMHDNAAVLNLLTAPAGALWYNGVLVADFTGYATETYVDDEDTLLWAAIALKSDLTHNHSLYNLIEKSYNSLTDKPDIGQLHSHVNKTTLDLIPTHVGVDEGKVMMRSAAGIAWNPLFNAAGTIITVDTMTELSAGVGITAEGLLLKAGSITLGTGSAVDTIEITITNDDTHLPTSGAVVDYCAGFGSGNVTKVGTPANNEIAVWTGDGTIEGESTILIDSAANTMKFIGWSILPSTSGSGVVGNSTYAWSGMATTSLYFKPDGGNDIFINSGVVDGASAIAYLFNTTNALSTPGAKIVSFKNNDTEKLYITYGGDLFSAQTSFNIGTSTGSTMLLSGTIAQINTIECTNHFTIGTGGDIIFIEKANHTSTPAAGFGYLWVKNDTPSSLIFTDDAGTDYDLTAIGGMVYPGAGIALSTGSAWGTSIADNSATWNAAQPGHANLTSLAGLTYASLSFVKMSASGTFSLDTATYLTSETSHSDVLVDGDFISEGLMRRGASAGVYSIITDSSVNWNTAYGWGDHASGGYAPIASPTFTGTVTTPSLIVTDLTDGYVPYQKAADDKLSNSNIFYDGTNVGIGTSTPTTKLDVEGTIVAPVNIRITNAGGSWAVDDEIGRYSFYTTDTSGVGVRELASIRAINTNIAVSPSSELAFYYGPYNAATAEAMRINKLGYVGIGTTAPQDTLHVYHATANTNIMVESGDVGANVGFKDNTTADYDIVNIGAIGNDMVFNVGYNERIRILSGGNVGIGTAAPYAPLTVRSTNAGAYAEGINLNSYSTVTSSAIGIDFNISTVDLGANPSARIQAIRMGAGALGDLAFSTRNSSYVLTEVLRLSSAGTVAVTGTLLVNSTAVNIAAFDSTSVTYADVIIDGGTGCDTLLSFKEDGTIGASIGYDAGDNCLFIVKSGGGVLSGFEKMAHFAIDGTAGLYHNNALKIATSAVGVTVTGVITATLGRVPAGSIYASTVSHDTIFDALAPSVPNTGNKIILTGGYSSASVTYIFSYAERIDATHIYLYYIQLAGRGYVNVEDGGATTLTYVSMAW